jgi:hypothetical protein
VQHRGLLSRSFTAGCCASSSPALRRPRGPPAVGPGIAVIEGRRAGAAAAGARAWCWLPALAGAVVLLHSLPLAAGSWLLLLLGGRIGCRPFFRMPCLSVVVTWYCI